MRAKCPVQKTCSSNLSPIVSGRESLLATRSVFPFVLLLAPCADCCSSRTVETAKTMDGKEVVFRTYK